MPRKRAGAGAVNSVANGVLSVVTDGYFAEDVREWVSISVIISNKVPIFIWELLPRKNCG
jgi:hypothetical protein